MIYMVDHIYTDPATEPAWHDWYAGYLHRLLSVPGIHSAQRFKAIGQRPSRYLAMYSVESADVYQSPAYQGIGGGGSQSVRFHRAYALWTRNLFEGAERAPEIGKGQHVLVIDSLTPHQELRRGVSPLWLKAAGLQMTTPYRAVIVLDAETAGSVVAGSGGYVYEPITPFMRS
ncbi:MAG: hypothetical protein A3G24_25225 [Betaproteobacteria bacterium RIFCSPLOWO2_12_FULL_62_13]|nr:MAG: hypothetical protein A3G24_25225 [Betaproteobacteria bacterium RIFCSPLOWO2_12_FULL_62_13]